MIWPFTSQTKNYLGIDIGTSAVRVVELSKYGEQEKLENYSHLATPFYRSTPLRTVRKGSLVFESKRLAEMVTTTLSQARIESKKAVFSIPDFSTLFTTLTLPPMAEEEIAQAVRFEARRHVPLPLSEVTLDWLISKGVPSVERRDELEVLLVVVPNRIIDQYMEVSELCGLEMLALEAEVFSLQRALIRGKKETACLIDIGAQSTTCNIVDKGVLRISHSFDVAGNDLTERIVQAFNVDYKAAEILKHNQGLFGGEQDIAEILRPLLGVMIDEIKKIVDIFYEKEGKEVQSYIISGGSGSLPGLKEYFTASLRGNISVGFPFKNMVYPPIIEKKLKEISPGFSIAVGAALKSLEYGE